MTTRKLASAAAAVSLAGVAVLGVSAPALAQEYPPASGDDTSISDSTVVAGQTVEVDSGAGSFPAGTAVAVEVPDTSVSGTTTAAANGNAHFEFEVPEGTPSGDFQVVFTGAGETVRVPFTVVAAAVAAPAVSQQPRTGAVALPRTGADQLVPLTIAGVVMVGVGGGIVVASRRRREDMPAGIA